MTNREADGFITLAIDVMDGKILVSGDLRRHASPQVHVRSFTCLADDDTVLARLPEWLAELRAEAELERLETQEEQDARLAASTDDQPAGQEVTNV